jgi:hypothetical protein
VCAHGERESTKHFLRRRQPNRKRYDIARQAGERDSTNFKDTSTCFIMHQSKPCVNLTFFSAPEDPNVLDLYNLTNRVPDSSKHIRRVSMLSPAPVAAAIPAAAHGP